MTAARRPHDDLLALAGRLADAAGAVAMRHFRGALAVDAKADASPVTVADREAELAMRSILEAERPEHGIFGEEHGRARLDAEYVWVLDPIDGTKSFVIGKPLFGNLIALLHAGDRWSAFINCRHSASAGSVWPAADHAERQAGQVARRYRTSRAWLATTTPEMFRAAMPTPSPGSGVVCVTPSTAAIAIPTACWLREPSTWWPRPTCSPTTTWRWCR